MANYLVPKDNFWAVTLKANNLTRKDVATLWGISTPTVTQNFNGLSMPTKPHIKAICDYCGVDIDKGTQEFKALVENRKSAGAPTRAVSAPRKYTPAAPTDNFWIKHMRKAGFNYVTLAQKLGISATGIRSYLIGYRMPSSEKIRQICEALNVSYKNGVVEFKFIFDQWGAEHADTFTKVGNYYVPRAVPLSGAAEEPLKDAPAEESAVTEAPIEISSPVADTLAIKSDFIPESHMPSALPDYAEHIYGIVPYEVFRDICTNNVSKDTVLEQTYGKIDYDVYMKLVDVL